ncbi:MAG TPA: hypothetical protein VMV49_10900, partial [Candidatus Deferrimicrobium sp.]|nr:hypothetical protein [Candidatus Deferrimicrobium sp.]
PWIDIAIQLPGIEMSGVTTVISYSKTLPTFVVTATPIPNITKGEVGPSFLIVLVTSPSFWSLVVVGLVALIGFGYMQKREEKTVTSVASRKIIKWLKRREKSWQTLVKANIMTESSFYSLRRLRYRIQKEKLAKNPLETGFEKVLSWKLIGTFLSTALLKRFWRDVNKKSRLIWIVGTLENMVISPLKHAWSTFKTALGYLNPWDMDRQRRNELEKKVPRKRYWKKIEPPRRQIRKKKIKVITSSPEVSKELDETKGKRKKGWTGKYMNDGGILFKKISDAKKLPSFQSRDGQIFYNLSKRKYVGMTLKQLAQLLKLPEYEILLSLIRLLEKGLVFLLQEGNTLGDDLWDITSALRKYDSELEKLIDSVSTLEDELEEGINFLKTDVPKENNPKITKEISEQSNK